jgi:hypothetical protein
MAFGQSAKAWRDHNNDDMLPDDILGAVFEGDHPYVTDNSFKNFQAAVNKRINYKTEVTADPQILNAFNDLLEKKFSSHHEEIRWSPTLFEEWNRTNAPAKQIEMASALEEFMRYTDKEFGRKEIFTKVEALLKRHKSDEWAGRIVNASSPLHNALSGPILSAALKRFNAVLSDRQECSSMMMYIQYAKDSTFCSERMSGDAEFIAECDFSENDMRQCKNVCPDVEARLLTRLGAPKWLTDIMIKANVYTVVSREHNFSGTVKYQLPSGSTSTTFRNTIWNMSIFWAWKIKWNVRGVAFFLGDDMAAKVTQSTFRKTRRGRKDASRSYEDMCKRARMVGKVKVHTHLVQAEFLSKNFVPSAALGHRMIPKIGKALARLNTRANNNQSIPDPMYMAGKCLSLSWEFRFVSELRDGLAARAAQTGVDLSTLTSEHFSYNFRQEMMRSGTAGSVLRTAANVEPLSYYDMENFCQVRYSMSWEDVLDVFDDIVCGDVDVPLLKYIQLARMDYW